MEQFWIGWNSFTSNVCTRESDIDYNVTIAIKRNKKRLQLFVSKSDPNESYSTWSPRFKSLQCAYLETNSIQ